MKSLNSEITTAKKSSKTYKKTIKLLKKKLKKIEKEKQIVMNENIELAKSKQQIEEEREKLK